MCPAAHKGLLCCQGTCGGARADKESINHKEKCEECHPLQNEVLVISLKDNHSGEAWGLLPAQSSIKPAPVAWGKFTSVPADWALAGSLVTLPTGSGTSLPCQVSWDPAGLQECGASECRDTALQGKQHHGGGVGLQGLETLGTGRESAELRREPLFHAWDKWKSRRG